jgi:hypothetical protein
MTKFAAWGLIGGVLTLSLVACQGGGSEAKGPQKSRASRPGKVSSSKSPERAFLDRIADAAGKNDAKELASMLHPDVIASFGEAKCVGAFQQDKAPRMVIAGAPVRSTVASWSNAQGRTQIYRDGPTFTGAITMMEGPHAGPVTSLDFGADKAGKFFLFADCSEKVFKVQE